jgi:hypothetical protein
LIRWQDQIALAILDPDQQSDLAVNNDSHSDTHHDHHNGLVGSNFGLVHMLARQIP